MSLLVPHWLLKLPVAACYLPFAAGAVAIWLISSISVPPVPDMVGFEHADKVAHCAAYLVLGGLAAVGAVRRLGLVPGAALEVFIATATYGVVDEIHQSMVPGRSATLGDIAADTVGALLASALVLHRIRVRRSRHPRGDPRGHPQGHPRDRSRNRSQDRSQDRSQGGPHGHRDTDPEPMD